MKICVTGGSGMVENIENLVLHDSTYFDHDCIFE